MNPEPTLSSAYSQVAPAHHPWTSLKFSANTGCESRLKNSLFSSSPEASRLVESRHKLIVIWDEAWGGPFSPLLPAKWWVSITQFLHLETCLACLWLSEAPLLSGTELGGSDNLTVGHISHISLVCPHEPTALFVPFFQRSFPLEFPLPWTPLSSHTWQISVHHPSPTPIPLQERILQASSFSSVLSQCCTKGNVICVGT